MNYYGYYWVVYENSAQVAYTSGDGMWSFCGSEERVPTERLQISSQVTSDLDY